MTTKDDVLQKLREISGRDITFGDVTYDPQSFMPYASISVDSKVVPNVVYSPQAAHDLLYASHFDTLKPYGSDVDHEVPKFDVADEYATILWLAIQCHIDTICP
jgi:hypothetical protein